MANSIGKQVSEAAVVPHVEGAYTIDYIEAETPIVRATPTPAPASAPTLALEPAKTFLPAQARGIPHSQHRLPLPAFLGGSHFRSRLLEHRHMRLRTTQ